MLPKLLILENNMVTKFMKMANPQKILALENYPLLIRYEGVRM